MFKKTIMMHCTCKSEYEEDGQRYQEETSYVAVAKIPRWKNKGKFFAAWMKEKLDGQQGQAIISNCYLV